MRSAAEKLRSSLSFLSPPLASRQLKSFTRSTTASTSPALTEEEVKQINSVIRRLCDSNHLKEAGDLISAALSTARPPLASLPLSSLLNRLASEPDLTHPMHLLNTLKYNPNASNPATLVPVVKMLLSSLLEKGRPKMALKVFQWMARPDFPGGAAADLDLYAVLVEGFCRNGMMVESLGVLRVMAAENLMIGDGIRVCVYRGLLRDARVREALELNAALGGTSASEKVVHLLEQMIANWVE